MDVIADARKLIETECYNYREKAEQEFSHLLPELSAELWLRMQEIHTYYQELQKQSLVGDLRWIFLSFMRTSMLDDAPFYRIDFYDSRGRASEVECSGSWGFDYIFSGYYKIKSQVTELWKTQSQVKAYEADALLENLALYFWKLAEARIPQLVQFPIEKGVSGEVGIQVMLGEFLDRAELIAEVDEDMFAGRELGLE